ncbi:MAG TPA: glycoside hydrolase family 36 protein, partial [Anaerolineales bacterium]|nr:glycoside hydrolase family 36 protein [Anaerolineales bacterium]
MEKIIELDDLTLNISADEIRETRDDVRLSGSRVTLKLPRPPKGYFHHGWQSWSLAAWTDLTPLPIQKPKILHPLQTDPVYLNETLPHGSWLGAVEFEQGKVLLLGALRTDTHVRLNGNNLEGRSEADSVEWLVAYGEEESIFADYVELLASAIGQIKKKPAPRIWCSWYSLYTSIDEPLLHKAIDGLGDLPFDVLQVDDGWQIGIGDWQANAKFPSGMRALAEKIKSTGRKAGLWLAPLIASESSQLFRKHRDWFLKDQRGKFVSAGFNWGQQLYALDTTHPAALEWLAALMKQVRAWGFDYLKLDFLYAGALPGKRYQELPREAAYRNGLKVLREAMGEDAFFLACGAPIIPSLGLCDA